jgi:hypothetical protein
MATYSSKKYPSGSVTSAQLADGTVVAVDLADGAITSAKLNSTVDLSGKTVTYRSIVAGDIASNAITTAKITDANITTDKINDSAVTGAKIASTTITQNKLGTGVTSTGPAFLARITSNQTGIAAPTYYKVTFNNEVFDTASCYDPTTNYRFTPNVAGYYEINLSIGFGGVNTAQGNAMIYKNGSEIERKWMQGSGYGYSLAVSVLVYMNGSTDYLEGYVQVTGSTETINSGTYSSFSGYLARAA